MTHPLTAGAPGPFRAEHLRDGDRYELRNGHPIYCAPAGRDHAARNLTGALTLESDPDVEWAGVDAGYSPEPGTLHAPDVAVGPAGDETGWIPGVPPLAVEYAAAGQDARDLREKIADLLRRGTQQVWVVRLVGSRRVEVHRPGQPVRLANPGEMLEAPGILRNPVPVEALYDRAAAHRAVLRNLLQREGYESLEAVLNAGIAQGIEQGIEQGIARGLDRGIEQGIAESILDLLAGRGLAPDAATCARIRACRDRAQLKRWLLAAARVEADAARIFDDDRAYTDSVVPG